MLQINSSHQGVAIHGRMEPFPRAYQGNQNPLVLRDAPYETSLSYSRNFLSTNDSYSNQNPLEPRDAPYETSLSYRRNFLSSNESDGYGTHGYDHCKGANPGVGTASNQSYGMVDPYRRTSLESRNPISMGATDPHRSQMVHRYIVEQVNHYDTQAESVRMTSFSHNTLGGHSSVPGGFEADQLATRDSRHLPTPYQMSYGRHFNSVALSGI